MRALDDMVNIEAAAAAACLAAPARTAAHLALDCLPFDPRSRGTTIHRRYVGRTSAKWASTERASALHGLPPQVFAHVGKISHRRPCLLEREQSNRKRERLQRLGYALRNRRGTLGTRQGRSQQ